MLLYESHKHFILSLFKICIIVSIYFLASLIKNNLTLKVVAIATILLTNKVISQFSCHLFLSNELYFVLTMLAQNVLRHPRYNIRGHLAGRRIIGSHADA